jgi:putative protease
MKKPELLSPAGDFESLNAALAFGADAVYIGGRAFSMRATPQNFTIEQIAEAAKLLHTHHKKLYIACNTLPRNDEIEQFPAYFSALEQAHADAFIISDLGVLEIAKRFAPSVDIHISTQAGVVNYAAANALFSAGAKRIVLARELSLEEISKIRAHTPEGLEIETFVHGAMCVSFSGRCLISSYLSARDSNRGECAQPCRWNYALCEEKRPGQYFPVYEDGQGTHILNARDLCMIEHIPELIKAGITSLKIEGRAKSAYYVAAVTNAYRLAIDAFLSQGDAYKFDPRLLDEVEKVSHRDYCTGFYFGPIQKGQDYQGYYDRGFDIAAVVEGQIGPLVMCRQRNSFKAGDSLEVLEPGCIGEPVKVEELFDENMQHVAQASHADMKLFLKTDKVLKIGAMIRKGRKYTDIVKKT